MPCIFSSMSPWISSSFSSNQSSVCKILVLVNPLLKSEWCLWKLSSYHLDPLNCVPVHLNGCRYHYWMLASGCFVSPWRHPNSLTLSCLVLAIQAEWVGWVCWQQACDLSNSLHHTVFVTLTSCLSFFSLRHSQWDAINPRHCYTDLV